ncbi:MAG: SDR family NAD(P)-dependent oxidoreductase [Gemmatimonadetes bacterium]|nr:SDR family NAD(P)-dependent oxidoreductase [Gemmatimonadota bacterium]NIO30503.1 SDR family NAD(P)-dependent oxidoreductase [Gemmatimonadota bacterium]
MSRLKVVLTGATGGVGRAVAERLAQAGAEMLVIGRRSEPLKELASRLGARTLVGDLGDRQFIDLFPERLSESWDAGPDILVNNAGLFELAPFGDTGSETFERLLAVNLRAPFELIRACLPGMLARGSGHIVNVGSVAGRKAFPGNAAYSASKFGLRGLHEVLVEELRGTGLRTTWIEPSAVDTPMWDRFDPDGRADLPSRAEMLEPGAVAEAVFFALAQPEDVAVEEIVIRANPAGRRI